MGLYDEFVQEFANNLNESIQGKELSDLVFLCVGTDRITGDSFGPLVGYKLRELYRAEKRVHIFGDLGNDISINNIEKILKQINEKYANPFVIAIDSAMANKDNIGKIVVGRRRMNLGSSLNKKTIKVGDISIKGVVAEDSGNPNKNFVLLQNTPLNLVMNMADTTAKGIYDIINI